MIIQLYTLLLSIFIANEALHAMAETGNGICMFVRIITALISAIYLLSSVVLFVLHQIQMDITEFFESIAYTQEAYFMRAMMGTAIAASMWNASFIRFLSYIEKSNPVLYFWLNQHFKTELRRALKE